MVLTPLNRGSKNVDAVTNPENPIVTKQLSLLTAAEVTENCPAKLADLGKRITAHLEKAAQCDEKANNHRISAAQCLLQAKDACDEGGFNAFRERCCPDLGRTRAYELLSIAGGKKTITEIRAATAGRMQKHRAEKKAASPSVTVTETAQPKASRPPTTAEQAQAQIAKAETERAKAEAQRAKAEAVARMFPAAATNGIPSASRERLIQALRMLASESQQERAEAAAAVERERSRLNMTWAELIVPAEVAEAEVRAA
jgi:hypothetical protein